LAKGASNWFPFLRLHSAHAAQVSDIQGRPTPTSIR
jgi:hypothetical protein